MPTISACLIVRDEEENLTLCLEALEPWVDEICVLDTGSTDRTVELATERGAKVGRFAWCDDFAAARNACLELATSDWILSVDADELLDPESGPALRAATLVEEAQAYLVWLDNLESAEAGKRPDFSSVGLARLYRNRPAIRWTRPVHESLMESLIALGAIELEHSGLRLVHSGYLPEVVRARGKRERNLAILSTRREAEPDDLFNLYKLATTCGTLDRIDEAREILEEAWSKGRALSAGQRASRPFLPLVAAELSRLSAECGLPGRGAEVASEGLEDYPTVSELLFHHGEGLRRTGDFPAAWKQYVAASTAEPWTDLYSGDPATRGHKPLAALAKLAAIAGDLRLAQETIARALEIAPDDLGVRALAARLIAVAGEGIEAWRILGGLLDEAPGHPEVALLAAEMAWSRDEREVALGFWKSARETRGGGATALAWLAVTELAAGDLEHVEEHLEALRPIDLPETAARVVLAAVAGRTLELEPAVDRPALLAEVVAWLQELGKDPEQRALQRFAAGAPSLVQAVPGIDRLVAEGGD